MTTQDFSDRTPYGTQQPYGTQPPVVPPSAPETTAPYGAVPQAPAPAYGSTPAPGATHARVPGAEQAALLEDALFQVKRVVVGQDRLVERVLLCLLADGHCLIEGFPGLAKTLTVSTLSKVVGGSFARIQFTPDLVPADLVGTRIWRPSTEDFDTEWGPVFANLVLADEINRAPAKVQSALLEAMGERQVTVGGHTRRLPAPFLVMATQNPIESEGVYALPEAQRDRFLMHVVVPQPTYEEEAAIASRMSGGVPEVAQVLTLEQLLELQALVRNVFVHHAVQDYAVRLVMATREPVRWGVPDLQGQVALGASPRGTLGLVAAARGLAVLRGRRFVVPQDVFDVAPEVLRHRVTLTYDAMAEGVTSDDVVRRVLSTLPAPRVAPQQDELPTQVLPYAGMYGQPEAAAG
jgi:MoxR-like ATPase